MFSLSAKRNTAPSCKIRSQVMRGGTASVQKIAVMAQRSVLHQATVSAMGNQAVKTVLLARK